MVPRDNHCGLAVSKSSGWGGRCCFQGKEELESSLHVPATPPWALGLGLSWGCGTACASHRPVLGVPNIPAPAPPRQGTCQFLGAGAFLEHRDNSTAERGTALGTGRITGEPEPRRTCPMCVPSDCAQGPCLRRRPWSCSSDGHCSSRSCHSSPGELNPTVSKEGMMMSQLPPKATLLPSSLIMKTVIIPAIRKDK